MAILIISHPADEHATAVAAGLEGQGRETYLFDLATFPGSVSLSIRFADGAEPSRIVRHAGGKVDLASVRVAWWRRPQPFGISEAITNAGERSFANAECWEAISGLWPGLDAFWVNDPQRDAVAARKSYQLGVAAACGLPVPSTLITNSPRRARRFIDQTGLGRTIYKTFYATPQHWRETRVLKAEELELLDRVELAPVIFQEFVPAEVDLRISVVGERIFASAVHAADTPYATDYRMHLDQARVEAAELPAEVEDRLRAFMRRLGLVYGAIDMRRTPEGHHVFLEINPAGQWLFMEKRTGQPITQAMVDLLAARDL